jgi:uncharacterized protein
MMLLLLKLILTKEQFMNHPVVHFEISGKDGKKLQEFYSKLFDWKINTDNSMGYGLVEADKPNIGGGITGTMDGAPASVTIYVQTSDLAASLKKAETLGGKTIMPPTTIPGMVSFAMFADPEGNAVGLVHDQMPPAE